MHPLRTLPSMLRILRELDSIVDFSRSTNQLVIIFYLSTVSDLTSLSTISYELGVSRKVVPDSMRKLERKGLVSRIVKDNDIYILHYQVRVGIMLINYLHYLRENRGSGRRRF